MLTALQLLKDQLKSARELFEGTTADIQTEHLHTSPGGKAFPLGATYAHLIFSEDVIVNQLMQHTTPLCEGDFKGKTGTDTPMPAMDANWSANNAQWSNTVRVNMDELRKYATAVFASTEAYVNNLTEADLEKEIDLGDWGKHTIADLLSNYIIGHSNSLAGEISALKGVQGATGYPF